MVTLLQVRRVVARFAQAFSREASQLACNRCPDIASGNIEATSAGLITVA